MSNAELGNASIGDFAKGMGTGEIRLRMGRGRIVGCFSSSACERMRLARWDTAIFTSQCPAWGLRNKNKKTYR
jgi:hypothetical protein